jgi:hypothetical protein
MSIYTSLRREGRNLLSQKNGLPRKVVAPFLLQVVLLLLLWMGYILQLLPRIARAMLRASVAIGILQNVSILDKSSSLI